MIRFLIKLITKPLGCLFTLVFGLLLFATAIIGGVLWYVDTHAAGLAEWQIEESTGFPTQVSEGSVSFLGGSVGFWNITIDNPTPRFPTAEFLQLSEIRADCKPSKLLGDEMLVETIVIDIKRLVFVKTTDGNTNLGAFGKNFSQSEGAEEPPRDLPPWRVQSFVFRLGEVRIIDYAGGGEPSVRTLDMNYERQFSNVSSIDPVMEQITADLKDRGIDIVIASFIQGLLMGEQFKELAEQLIDAGGFTLETGGEILDAGGEVIKGAGEALQNLFDSERE